MKRALAAVTMLLALAGGGIALFGWWHVNAPASGSTEEVVVEIPRGSGSASIAARLARAGVVKDARLFRLYIRATRQDGRLKAGEFLFRKDLTPAQVLKKLVRGEVMLHKLTVPEGYRATDIANLVGASGLGEEAEFLRLAEDAAFARSLGVPADRLEGYLFPDTYWFSRDAGAKVIATAMVKRFHQEWTPEMEKAAAALGLGVHEAVTFASIVEKETGDPTERGVIAGVFHNRLKRKMRLESDPTIIYGMKDYDGNIRRKDIRDPSNRYSTYVIPGLPPGPIASPGKAALRAAGNPDEHDWLFFVATGAGGAHVFSRTYAEHLRNVEKYQIRPYRRRRAPAPPAVSVPK